jgi:hypothetical protein
MDRIQIADVTLCNEIDAIIDELALEGKISSFPTSGSEPIYLIAIMDYIIEILKSLLDGLK